MVVSARDERDGRCGGCALCGRYALVVGRAARLGRGRVCRL